MTTVVRPLITRSSASCTMYSESASSALVASSSSRMLGLRTRARAMAMRCFCPPDICTPFSPQLVWYPAGSSEMKLCALASLAACSTSSALGVQSSGSPNTMLS
mmetsp:Transcript_5844/g.10524  ORF Transcript_5844/g.10524 Transcript_5844/m.10524 type:complete len:104 (+) Transcript_5844:142-453(+)